MTKTDPNVPASPTENYSGVTKREYFAVLAMQGLTIALVKQGRVDGRQVALEAVEQADFLIEELDKEKLNGNTAKVQM